MPTPPLVEPVAPDAGELPIYSSDDVWKLAPAKYRNSPKKPLLDNMIEALTEIALGWEDICTKAAQQSEVSSATDQFLDGLGDDRQVYRATDEETAQLQDRMVAVPRLVDTLSILAAVNEILDPITPIKAELFDSILDRLFISDGTASWHSFIGSNPQYLDRLYLDDAAANGGDYRPQARPGGAQVFADQVGRYFVLRVPDLGAIDVDHGFVFDATTTDPDTHVVINAGKRLFVGDGSQSVAAAYVSLNNRSALTVYQAIADKVNQIVGQGIRWKLVVDPKLS